MLGLNKELEEWFLDLNPYPSICKALEMDGLFGQIFSKALIEEKKTIFPYFLLLQVLEKFIQTDLPKFGCMSRTSWKCSPEWRTNFVC